jgi:hypothetical protein
MKEMQRAQQAGRSTAFIAVVILAIVVCIGLLVWRAGAGDSPNGPPALADRR